MSSNEVGSSRALFTETVRHDVYPFIDPTKPEFSMKGKVVLVTGGGRGIGIAIVEAFAKAQAKTIILTGRTESSLHASKESFEKIHPGTTFIALTVDIGSPESVDNLYSNLKGKVDHIDVFVNSAGLLSEAGSKVADTSLDKFLADINANTVGPYLLSRGLIKFNPTDYPTTFITLTTSIDAEIPNVTSYLLSKLPPVKLVQILNAEYENIRAFAFIPGLVPTDMILDAFKPYAIDTAPLSGALSVWLSSPQADFLSGRVVDARWDMEQVVAQKEEIVKRNWLKVSVSGY
ncbi:NAD(P)-binding protein [Serendipita vermifera]|nr:NAD(P)-binding protein [Serendipita vermifera]